MTLTELQAELDETAGYRAAGDLALALRYQTALEQMIVRVPQQTSKDGVSVALPIATYEARLKAVERWILSQTSRGQVRHQSLRGFRE